MQRWRMLIGLGFAVAALAFGGTASFQGSVSAQSPLNDVVAAPASLHDRAASAFPAELLLDVPNVPATPRDLEGSVSSPSLLASTPSLPGDISNNPDELMTPTVTHADGRVCNSSGRRIIVTVTQAGQFITGGLPSGYCTADSIDAEGIWGKWCNASGTCYYQLWKVAAWSFSTVSAGGNNVKITGTQWPGSGWLTSIPAGWPWPSGSSLTYTLIR